MILNKATNMYFQKNPSSSWRSNHECLSLTFETLKLVLHKAHEGPWSYSYELSSTSVFTSISWTLLCFFRGPDTLTRLSAVGQSVRKRQSADSTCAIGWKGHRRLQKITDVFDDGRSHSTHTQHTQVTELARLSDGRTVIWVVCEGH